MGLSMEDINAGVANAGTLINQSMDAWDRIQRSLHPSTATPPIAATTTGGAIPPISQTSGTSPAQGGGMGTLVLIGLGLLIARKLLK